MMSLPNWINSLPNWRHLLKDEVIKICNLNYAYRIGQAVLQNVDLTVKRGENCCILGPNGGGKTTLLRLLLGFIEPDSGTLEILGDSVRNARHKIGYMPQVQNVESEFPVSVLEVVMMGTLCGTFGNFFNAPKRSYAMEMLEKMNVAHLAKRSFSQISGGEKQRVLIARSLASKPEILLLDEPTANIDPGAEQCFYEMLDGLQKELTLLTVSHDLGFVNRNINKIICVNKFVRVHNPADFDAADINEIYRHDVKMVEHAHDCLCGCDNHSHIRRRKK